MDCSPLDSVSSTAALPFFHVVARAGGGGGRGGSGGMGGAGGGMGSESAWDPSGASFWLKQWSTTAFFKVYTPIKIIKMVMTWGMVYGINLKKHKKHCITYIPHESKYFLRRGPCHTLQSTLEVLHQQVSNHKGWIHRDIQYECIYAMYIYVQQHRFAKKNTPQIPRFIIIFLIEMTMWAYHCQTLQWVKRKTGCWS